MRLVSAALLSLCLAGAVAPPSRADEHSLEMTSRLAESGALTLALSRVDRFQQTRIGQDEWDRWEALRLKLLFALHRNAEIVKRVEALPPETRFPDLNRIYLLSADAALNLNKPEQALTFLGRMLWLGKTTESEYRLARERVIDALLAAGRPRQAYLAMLRFDQEFHPISREHAKKFVQGLVEAGMAQEAATWVRQMGDEDPLKWVVRLELGLATPEAAIRHARQILAKTPANTSFDASRWELLRRAALARQDAPLYIEASERALESRRKPENRGNPDSAPKLAEGLWSAYRNFAVTLANSNQLLVGDDAAWFALGERLHGTQPAGARALFGYLAEGGRLPSLRHSAQERLIASLQASGLAATAVALFENGERFPAEGMAPSARYSLGGAAFDLLGDFPLASRWWKGMAPPQGMALENWVARQARALTGGGLTDEAAATLRKAMPIKEKLAPEAAEQYLAVIRFMMQQGASSQAEKALGALLSATTGTQYRQAMYWLGRAASAQGNPGRAADYYLQAATLDAAGRQDTLARDARFEAAICLVRAGYLDDARAQYRWLLTQTKQKDEAEFIRRELERLGNHPASADGSRPGGVSWQ